MPEQIFHSFEDRDAYLRGTLKIPIPRRHDGPAIFYSDFLAAMQTSVVPDYAFVTPNPLDYLPFDRVRMILNSAFRLAGLTDDTQLNNVVSQFDLTNLLQRLIYTLSGGEVVRVAMAKCVLESHYLKRLIVAAPWSLLSSHSHRYVRILLEAYKQNGNTFELLNLAGDEDESSIPPPTTGPETGGLVFSLLFQSARIPLSDYGDIPHTPTADVDDFASATLRSPCLITGENGHGKSLLMKALAGAIRYDGHISMPGTPNRRVRLLFQDVSNQALLAAAAPDSAIRQSERAPIFYELMLHDLKSELTAQEEGPTLLKTKVAMVAIRLVDKDVGLVLDEPDWGLTKKQALAFLRAVVAMCDKLDIPLLVISHRPWFDHMMRSRLRFERLPSAQRGDAMRIRISQ